MEKRAFLKSFIHLLLVVGINKMESKKCVFNVFQLIPAVNNLHFCTDNEKDAGFWANWTQFNTIFVISEVELEIRLFQNN